MFGIDYLEFGIRISVHTPKHHPLLFPWLILFFWILILFWSMRKMKLRKLWAFQWEWTREEDDAGLETIRSCCLPWSPPSCCLVHLGQSLEHSSAVVQEWESVLSLFGINSSVDQERWFLLPDVTEPMLSC